MNFNNIRLSLLNVIDSVAKENKTALNFYWKFKHEEVYVWLAVSCKIITEERKIRLAFRPMSNEGRNFNP